MTLFEQIKAADIWQLAEILSQFSYDAEPTENECLALLRSEAWHTGNENGTQSFQIKPCPFCGGQAHISFSEMSPFERKWVIGAHGLWWYVVCEQCNACTGDCVSETQAVAAWNRRAKRNQSTSDSNASQNNHLLSVKTANPLIRHINSSYDRPFCVKRRGCEGMESEDQ